MNPSQEEALSTSYRFVQQSLQLQEYAKQLQVHLDKVDLDFSEGDDLIHICLAHMQDRVKQIEEHVAQMRG